MVSAVVVAVAALVASGSAAGAEAATVAGSGGGFYTPPSPLPAGHDGDLIRSEPSHLAWPVPARATRIMYRSEDTHGKPIAVTGTYFDPTRPWKGGGPRPLVSLAPGTQGQGDQCAPSKLVNRYVNVAPPGGPMVEYEVAQVDTLLAEGAAVVMTDYEGLGTPGMHTYVNRASEAHAVLDAARAAQRLPDTTIPADGPVGLWGYSQGGGASAAAAELAGSYAPGLHVKGAYAGAPPADLEAVLKQVDGGALAGVIGYTLNSMSAAYPELRPIIAENTNDAGKAMLSTVSRQCIGATVLGFAFRHTSSYTVDGRPLDAVLKDIPEAQRVLAANKIGNGRPDVPTLVVSGSDDDIVPHAQARRMAADWCHHGATVKFTTVPEPPFSMARTGINHILGGPAGLLSARGWLNDRFAGEPAPDDCVGL